MDQKLRLLEVIQHLFIPLVLADQELLHQLLVDLVVHLRVEVSLNLITTRTSAFVVIPSATLAHYLVHFLLAHHVFEAVCLGHFENFMPSLNQLVWLVVLKLGNLVLCP